MKIILVVHSGTKWGLKSEKKNVVVISSIVTIFFFFEQIKKEKMRKR